MFRSVSMSYVQVLLPAAVAEEFVDEVARENCMEFTDLNEDFQPFQRQYTADIIKIQEIERKVKSIEELLETYQVPMSVDVASHDIEEAKRPSDSSQIVENISTAVNDEYKSLTEQAAAEKQLNAELESQQDSIRVLTQIDTFLESETEAQRVLEEQREAKAEMDAEIEREQARDARRSPNAVPLLEVQGGARRDVGFKYFAGVVTIGQRVAFERQVFLTSRGNSFIQFDDESDNDDDNKIPFVVFFLGDQLKRSLKRLCQFMNIQICYESDSDRSREELLQEANNKRNDFTRIHLATKSQLDKNMRRVCERLKDWKIALLQEKGIRITLNKFRTHQANVLRAQGWCPENKKDRISEILDEVTRNKGVGRAVLTPCDAVGVIPTHFELNEFTKMFQTIVDTYGVPRYQEFNPAVPTIVTFPFLFGVMYGDMFHASFLFLFALALVFGHKLFPSMVRPGGSLEGMYEARYVLLFMGFFALYCGLIYNDAMSISINGFNHTQWETYNGTLTNYELVVIQKDGVYAVGIDPDWHGKTNQLTFENSLKMKLSVIIGVIQMTFGLFLKLSNHIFEQDYISVFCEFVPQLIFMTVFFIYMDFLIIYKWCIDWTSSTLGGTPSIITILIKMVLNPTTFNDDVILYDKELQQIVQNTFVILMFLSIPWMLIPKPLILRQRHNANSGQHGHHMVMDNDLEMGDHSGNIQESGGGGSDDSGNNKAAGGGHGGGHGHGEEFEFSEVLIHQLIHTIEYVLGTVSNTASYLRLWALSLAHAELAEVFYSKTILSTLPESGWFYVFANVGGVFFFLMFTFGVLMVMDILECFLHALRLHWVEFQNKFYYADGVAFEPFSYKQILAE